MSETKELVVLNNQGGLGLDTQSKLFKLKPATLTVNQRMTRADGAIPGKLRLVETGQQFDSIEAVLLKMPSEGRQYHAEGVEKSKDTVLCYSRDMIRPDPRGKAIQAMNCASCPKADWSAYRASKNPQDLPKCDSQFYVLFIDSVYKMPIQMYIKGASKKPFTAAMQELARKIFMLQAEGKNPSIFSVKFRISTEPGNKLNYVLKFDNFAEVTPEEAEKFGSVFVNYVNSAKQLPAVEEAEEEAAIAESIEAQLTNESPQAIDGVYEV